MKNEIQCPEHNVPLKKKYISYGLPNPNVKYGDVIFGGCFVTKQGTTPGFANSWNIMIQIHNNNIKTGDSPAL